MIYLKPIRHPKLSSLIDHIDEFIDNHLNRWRWFYWQVVRHTLWMHIFDYSRRTRWTQERFTGWLDDPNQLARSAQYVGVAETGEMFYVNSTISEIELSRFHDYEVRNFLREKVEELRLRLDSYLDPRCRCRLGFHWKCAVHKRWNG